MSTEEQLDSANIALKDAIDTIAALRAEVELLMQTQRESFAKIRLYQDRAERAESELATLNAAGSRAARRIRQGIPRPDRGEPPERLHRAVRTQRRAFAGERV